MLPLPLLPSLPSPSSRSPTQNSRGRLTAPPSVPGHSGPMYHTYPGISSSASQIPASACCICGRSRPA
eukprot:6638513-Prymnesium_polylepis.1